MRRKQSSIFNLHLWQVFNEHIVIDLHNSKPFFNYPAVTSIYR